MKARALPVVLLPGMMCDARLFTHQTNQLSTVRAVHVGCLTTADSMEALATDVLTAAPERFHLAGLSMGGIVAMEIMRVAAERVASLALLDTNPLSEPDAVAIQRRSQMSRVADGMLDAVMKDELKPNYLADGPHVAAVLDTCMAMARNLGADVFIRQSTAIMNRPDQQHTLTRIRVPTSIITGESDTLCPIDRHELMHRLIPGSTLSVIECAGHLPTLEQPHKTNEILLQWLNKTDE